MNRLLAYNPNLAQSWGLIAIFILCYVVGVIARVVMQKIGLATPEWAEFSGKMLAYIILAVVIVRFGKGSNNVKATIPDQSPLLWLLLVPFTLSVVLMATLLTIWIPRPDSIKQALAVQVNLPMFLELVILAPVREEWLYRGVILKGLLKHYSPLKAIVWSALIFAVAHLNPWQAIPVFSGALAMGWIYWRIGLLRYCVFMHAVNNALVFIAVSLFSDAAADDAFTDLTSIFCTFATILFVGVLTTIGIKKIISPRTVADKQSSL